MTYGNVNVETVTTSTAGGILGAGNASIMKNRIINGAMVINQRGASGTITTGNYLVDRFKFFQDTTATLTYTQSTDAPAGFVNSSLITVTSGGTVTTGQGNSFLQPIEGYNIADLNWGTANAKTVTLSFWVKCSATGTFGGSITNGTNSRSYPFTYTISSANTWIQASVTIAGDTTGTWSTTNSSGLIVWFGLGTGSTLSGTAGTWAGANYVSATGATNIVGTTGATFYITGVQLEVGSSATGFEYRQYQQELALCQRYYEQINPGQATAGAAAGSVAFLNGTFQVQKRSAPSMGGGSGIQVRIYTSGGGSTTYTGSSIAATNYTNTTGYEVQVGGFSGMSNGFGSFYAASSPYVASAEL